MKRPPVRAALLSLLLLTYYCVPVRADLAQEATHLLDVNCSKCHGSEEAQKKHHTPFGSLDVFKLRKDKELIIPGDPTNSGIYQRIAMGDMPPVGKSLTDAEAAIIKKWIEAGAPAPGESLATNPAPATKSAGAGVAPASQAATVTDSAMNETILHDLNNQPAENRPFLRYVNFTHLKNSGYSDSQIQVYKEAFSKLMNSLSWGNDIVQPVDVKGDGTILRIDLRQYGAGWDKNTWELIANANPYGVNCSSVMLQGAQAATGTQQPVIRGDWFIDAASRPPLYHQILRMPAKDRDLEDFLGINITANTTNATLARAGFSHSGVSNNNRMIERHPSKFGAYWKSYDFNSNKGAGNLFTHPFFKTVDDERNFQHAGGEIIFNLPNGTQAYMLVKADGTRLDKAPTNIVQDHNRPDGAVENGVSCMNCHFSGMLPKDDEIRPAAESHPNFFTGTQLAGIRAWYPERGAFAQLQAQDKARFTTAMTKAGVTDMSKDPINGAVSGFEAELDLRQAAAELGVSEVALRNAIGTNPAIGGPLAALATPKGVVKRDEFVGDFANFIKGLNNSCKPISTCAVDTNVSTAGIASCSAANPGVTNPIADPAFTKVDTTLQKSDCHLEQDFANAAASVSGTTTDYTRDGAETERSGLNLGPIFEQRCQQIYGSRAKNVIAPHMQARPCFHDKANDNWACPYVITGVCLHPSTGRHEVCK